MTPTPVNIAVFGYEFERSVEPITQEAVTDLASSLASEIGSRIADLGDSYHGEVWVYVDGKLGKGK